MFYSKVDVQAFATARVAVALCSVVTKGSQSRSQEFWMGDETPKATRGGGGMRGGAQGGSHLSPENFLNFIPKEATF